MYRQVSGTTMGAKCAPSNANLYKTHIIKWFSFIDDTLFSWAGSKEECMGFISELNNNDLNIRLTSSVLDTTVEFLVF